MQQCYKLKDSMYSVRVVFSKETVKIRKKVWDQVKNLQKGGKYLVIKFDKIVTKDFPHRQ